MAAYSDHSNASRHSILDLAPLELDCMNALWPSGEATVRQIQEALRPTRPRAYTTIMTILDRLTQKGVVERRKAGRAWVYRPNVSVDQARAHAVSQVVDGFFSGNAAELATHLSDRRAEFRSTAIPLIVGAKREIESLASAEALALEKVPEETSAESAKSAPTHLDAALL